ncbi:ketopantoate reductase family protein [Sphingomonas alpina]|uniref:Ketopantoate reductase n=1 Tax=Sphingomonas alpina TaxID=653931 RepID=A0A7H0LH03_9SPHN|nr:2-dehydropantoate 2-reductase N-terminal domain-containing protein [Sphingomonas alpina]QNQ08956.1 ketopantoate reductase [Sphingomonas alpina]
MKILVVGAGAVGAVYGWHLHRAGHEVHFFVKAKFADTVSAGFTLHWLGHRATQRQDWNGVRVVTDTAAVARERWDQVWLTMSSDALRGELAAQLLAAVGTATLVCLQPDLEDADYVRGRVGAPEQVVQGLITLISYQSPLPGMDGPDGIAYYLPPLARTPFSGSLQRVADVVEALKAGGMSASAVANVATVAAGPTALMQPLIAALEVNQWRLATLPASDALRMGLAAAREALAVAQRTTGARTGRFRPLLRPWIWRLLLPLAVRLLPLPLERYLHYHFSKVGAQTRLMLATYIRLGRQHGQDTQALQNLRKAMPAL